MSKSKHSSKEVQQFLYNEKGVQALGKILGKTVKTAQEGIVMLSREDIIKYITKCVDCAMPILQDENGLDVSRGYSFMLDKDKKAKVHIVFENCI